MRLLSLLLVLALPAEAKPPVELYDKLAHDHPFQAVCTKKGCKLKPTTDKPLYDIPWWEEFEEKGKGKPDKKTSDPGDTGDTCPDCGGKETPGEEATNGSGKKDAVGDHDDEEESDSDTGEKRATGGRTERGKPIPCGRLSADRMEFGSGGGLLPHRYYEIRVKAEGDSWALGTGKDECVGVMTDDKGKILGKVLPFKEVGEGANKKTIFSSLKGRQVGERDPNHFTADFVSLPVKEEEDNEKNETGLVFFPVSCGERDRKPMALAFVQKSPTDPRSIPYSYVVDGEGNISRLDEETMLAAADFLKGEGEGGGREVQPPSVLEEPRL